MYHWPTNLEIDQSTKNLSHTLSPLSLSSLPFLPSLTWVSIFYLGVEIFISLSQKPDRNFFSTFPPPKKFFGSDFFLGGANKSSIMLEQVQSLSSTVNPAQGYIIESWSFWFILLILVNNAQGKVKPYVNGLIIIQGSGVARAEVSTGQTTS